MIDQFQFGMIIFEALSFSGCSRATGRQAEDWNMLTRHGLQQHQIEDIILGHGTVLRRPQRRQFNGLGQ